MNAVLAPRASSILYDLLVSRGDRRPFLLPANICPIVPITFFKARIPFEFLDISPQSLHIDLEQAEARLGGSGIRYAGLLYAHPYGDEYAPTEALVRIRDRFPHLLLIDDRCLCVPDLTRESASWADVTLYSTGYAKIVDIGYGGFAFIKEGIAVQHQKLAFSESALRAQEASYKTHVEARTPFSYDDSDWLETDSALPAWQAYKELVAAALEDSLAHRNSLNAVYNALVPPELHLPVNYQMWRFNVRVKSKRPVLEAIFKAGLFASSHYAALVDIMGEGEDEHARELAEHVINLFNDHHYTLDMAEKTAQIVRRSI